MTCDERECDLNASAMPAGTRLSFSADGYPINVLGRIKDVPEVVVSMPDCEPVEVVVGGNGQGRGFRVIEDVPRRGTWRRRMAHGLLRRSGKAMMIGEAELMNCFPAK